MKSPEFMIQSPRPDKLDRLAAFVQAFELKASIRPVDDSAEGPCLLVLADGEGGAGSVVLRVRGAGAPAGGVPVVAAIAFSDSAHPLMSALPAEVRVPLDAAPALKAVTEVLVSEARGSRCGRAAALKRLAEVLVLLLLRELIDAGTHHPGLFAALAHPQLHRALVAMHEQPARPWTVPELAEQAAMSRTQFMGSFRREVGTSPMAYLSTWRLALATRALEAGHSVKSVARQVGFQSPAAFSRAYARAYGHAPTLDRPRLDVSANRRSSTADIMQDTKQSRPVDNTISKLPNLGPKSLAMLASAGITDASRLRELGSVAAYARVKAVEPQASLNLLWALEGALTGEHWRTIANDHRTSLLLRLDTFLASTTA